METKYGSPNMKTEYILFQGIKASITYTVNMNQLLSHAETNTRKSNICFH